MKSSRRPRSIRKDRNNCAPSEKKAKLCEGSTPPIPGPIFPRHAILAPAEVTMSCPNADMTNAPSIKIKI